VTLKRLYQSPHSDSPPSFPSPLGLTQHMPRGASFPAPRTHCGRHTCRQVRQNMGSFATKASNLGNSGAVSMRALGLEVPMGCFRASHGVTRRLGRTSKRARPFMRAYRALSLREKDFVIEGRRSLLEAGE
jgi:hypothetical protein